MLYLIQIIQKLLPVWESCLEHQNTKNYNFGNHPEDQ